MINIATGTGTATQQLEILDLALDNYENLVRRWAQRWYAASLMVSKINNVIPEGSTSAGDLWFKLLGQDVNG